MGYTHYFEQQRDLTETEFTQIAEAAKKFHDNANCKLEFIIDGLNNTITINGVGDDSHEDFVIRQKNPHTFTFCKTARKPYDHVVGALLIELYRITEDGPSHRIGSDGDAEDWEDAINFWEANVDLSEDEKSRVMENFLNLI